MRSGLFAFFENPHGDTTRALHEQVALVREAEALGMDEVWVSEHHFNDYSVSGPILQLMAYLCGVTERIRIGSAAVLLPYHAPIMVAESLATLSALGPERILFGMAKGAFPMDDRHFRSDPERNRAVLYEAALLIERLLKEEAVTFDGDYHTLKQTTVVPRPTGSIPAYLATFGSEESIRFAAEHGFELMMGQTATLEQIETAVTLYERTCGRRPDLVVLRLCSIDPSGQKARTTALASAHHFSERMRSVKAGTQHSSAGGFAETRARLFEAHPMAERGIVGTPEACRTLLKSHESAGVTAVAIRPVGDTLEANKAILRAFSELTTA